MKIIKIFKSSSNYNKKWIGVDLDGTLAEYDKWMGPEHIGEPIEKMKQRVESWINEGKNVKILTARVANAHGEREAKECRKHIRNWLVEVFGEIGEEIEITCEKDQDMDQLWDDRAISVEKNTGELKILREEDFN